MTIAVGLGIGSAYVAVNHSDSLDYLEVGPWRAWPNDAGPTANPYSKADQARKGSFPIGSGEGMTFVAITDKDGTPLDGTCQYSIEGKQLPARLWTLSLISRAGELVDNPSLRYSFHSRDVARLGGDQFEITTGPSVMGGNWLMSPMGQPFQLVLRLYETSLTSGGGLGEVELPQIKWVSCQ